ncbi:MAG: hypothetical protein AB7O21_20110 [Gammaproteobacteria bacterium]
MELPRLADMKGKWVPAIGWVIFIGLVVAMLADHYIFDPFIFGFAYYIVFVLKNSLSEDEQTDPSTMRHRLMLLGIIALLYMWFHFNNGVQQRNFVRQFERTCYANNYARTPAGQRVCEEIQSHIDNVLHKPDDDSDNRDF